MFRNIVTHIPIEPSCSKLYEVQGDKIVESILDKVLPCSNDFSLKDLLSAGVKVAPVDSTIVHDSSITDAVAHDFIDNFDSNND